MKKGITKTRCDIFEKAGHKVSKKVWHDKPVKLLLENVWSSQYFSNIVRVLLSKLS